MAATRKCKNGERECPKKPKMTTTTATRKCKYGERDIHGKCPKKPKTTTRKVNTKPYSNKEKPNWDSVCTKKKIKYLGKTYSILVLPKNTYVYRGFDWGSDPRHPEYTEEDKDFEKKQYKKQKDKGIYYANISIAGYYAFNPDSRQFNHVIIEYKTNEPLHILDMSVWKNLKNIVDDMSELNEVFETTHGFQLEHPKQKLERWSGGTDEEMTELMNEWLQNHPLFDGFGHVKMPGFHSEFTCNDRNKLTEVNEYASKGRAKEMNDIQGDILPIERLRFVDGDKKPFQVIDLL
jgi:hypothetical protein